jgi:hypothetical protein
MNSLVILVAELALKNNHSLTHSLTHSLEFWFVFSMHLLCSNTSSLRSNLNGRDTAPNIPFSMINLSLWIKFNNLYPGNEFSRDFGCFRGTRNYEETLKMNILRL